MSLRIRPILAEAVSLPDGLDRDEDLAGDHQRRGEDPVAYPFLGRRRLAGQRVLVDHGHPLDDVAVDRHDLAGVDDDEVALLEPVERDLDLGAVAVEPGVPRLLAERVEQQLLRVVLGPLDQEAAEAEAPAEHGAGEDRHGPQAADDHDRVEHVDAEPLLLDQDLARLAERGDRRVGEHRRRRGQERRDRELGRRRDRQRRRADRQVQVELVERRRVLGGGERRVEDLDHLVRVELPRVVVDLDRAGERAGPVLVDPQHAHQLALDGLAETRLAVQGPILQADPPAG